MAGPGATAGARFKRSPPRASASDTRLHRFDSGGSMRRLTLALLSGAYICISMITALMVWRIGGGAGAGAAALVGALGLCFSVHGLIARLAQSGALAGEIEAVRQAHLILTGEIEKMQARITDIAETVIEESQRRSEEIYSEVQLL